MPVMRPALTPDELQKRKEGVAKRAAATKTWEEQREAHRKMLDKNGEEILRLSGSTEKGVRRENMKKDMARNINTLLSGGNEEAKKMIQSGDMEGLIRLAAAGSYGSQNVRELKKKARAEEAKRQRRLLKEALANEPPERHARVRELHAYEAQKEIARAGMRAEDDSNALHSIWWRTRKTGS